ncbi:ribonuclease R [Clostridia bacterium OttesenSCG-928-O13]|nr:ribonuclease R [Clostridia bacterium OttesenSCG-928-O13]
MSLKSELLKELASQPQTEKQLRKKYGAEGKKLLKVLKLLEREKEIKKEKGVYSLVTTSAGLVEGKLVKLGRSFGFVEPLDGSGDIFVPGHSLKGAMPQDEVTVSLMAYPRVHGSREGEVISITKPHDVVAGTVIKDENGNLALLPDNAPNTPLAIKRSADGGVKEGEKAAGQILERGLRHDEIRVGIIQRFGSASSARQCAKSILFLHGISKSFSDTAKNEAKQAAAEKLSKEVLKSRVDLREEIIFTIDSDTTKDMDDAISAQKTENGFTLSVHIADVSHYVAAKTVLDEEALGRGTSVYYADTVIPMLPKVLSNDVCSLNPGVDRLAFSCKMELDRDGRMLDYQFQKTVIRSCVKGVYSEINQLLDRSADEELQAKYAPVKESLAVLHEIYTKLATLRDARGCMEIESDEAALTIDAAGKCVGVEKRSRGVAERMIEEFMLLANTAAAHLARRRQLPFVYRVHERPSAEKVSKLSSILTALGVDYHFKEDIPTQTELSALLDKTRGTNLEIPVHNAILRTMSKAKYDALPQGHYGLALSDYAHFTSPIRRYPDLAIHRILSDVVAGASDDTLQKRYRHFATSASAISSEREVAAVQVERDCDDCYKAEYMKQFVGKAFDGIITSVMSFGVYVGLPNTVEGLVHTTLLSEHRLELKEGVSLYDAVSGREYRIGDAVRVKVVGVDVSQGNIDFALADSVV